MIYIAAACLTSFIDHMIAVIFKRGERRKRTGEREIWLFKQIYFENEERNEKLKEGKKKKNSKDFFACIFIVLVSNEFIAGLLVVLTFQ